MKSKSFVLMTLSLGFGLIAALGITQVMGKNKAPEAPKVEMGQVVVAIEHLGHKVLLNEENVRVENWPKEIIPENAVKSLDEIQDMAIMTRLSKGLPILASDIVNKKDAMGIDIPPGFKVVAIKVSADDNIAGLLRPGDRVDVIGLIRNQERGQTQTVSRTFLKGLEVFSVNANMTADGGRREDGGSNGSAIVGLLVNEKQSEDIVYVQKTGQLKLVLRGDAASDAEIAEAEGALQDALYGSNAPEIAGAEPVKKPEYEKMIVWVGNDYQEISFEPGSVPKTAFSDSSAENGVPAVRDDDQEDSDISEEIDNELEEDQYPAS